MERRQHSELNEHESGFKPPKRKITGSVLLWRSCLVRRAQEICKSLSGVDKAKVRCVSAMLTKGYAEVGVGWPYPE